MLKSLGLSSTHGWIIVDPPSLRAGVPCQVPQVTLCHLQLQSNQLVCPEHLCPTTSKVTPLPLHCSTLLPPYALIVYQICKDQLCQWPNNQAINRRHLTIGERFQYLAMLHVVAKCIAKIEVL